MGHRKSNSPVDFWNRAASVLEAERIQRLRAMTDEDVRAAVRDLLGNVPDLPSKRTSGLVEQQAWFRLLK